MAKTPPTEADLQAARNLSALYENWQNVRVSNGLPKMRQDELGSMMGISQGAVSQYLRGATPLGVEAVLMWAKVLGCSPDAIRDDLDIIPKTTTTNDDMFPIGLEEKKLLRLFAGLVVSQQTDFIKQLEKANAHNQSLLREFRHRRFTSTVVATA